MLYGDFLKLCEEKDIINLVSFMLTPTPELSSKIVVSAILEQYSPEIASTFGINVWNDRLSNEPVPPILNLIAERVDLIDFAKAYKIATGGLTPQQPGLEDEQLGDIIKNYVYKNQQELSAILLAGSLDQEANDFIVSAFPSLAVNTEMSLLNLLADIQEKFEETLLLADEIQLRKLLGYTAEELSLEKDFILGLDLQFNNNPSIKVLKEYAQMLQSMGLDASYYNLPLYKDMNVRGLLIQEDLLDFSEKLIAFSDAKVSKLGMFAQANAHLERANDLREKSVSDVELANSDFGQASNTARMSR